MTIWGGGDDFNLKTTTDAVCVDLQKHDICVSDSAMEKLSKINV